MKKKSVPFSFVIDYLYSLDPLTKPMFGCTAIYVHHKIMLVLRDKPNDPGANGIWIATVEKYHEELKRILPELRTFSIFGKRTGEWLILPSDAGDFERSAVTVCEMILKKDQRIGKVPKK
jgi:hypothetical protein